VAWDLENTTIPVGAGLAREAFSDLEAPFAAVRRPDKPCSYSSVLNAHFVFGKNL